MEQQGIAASWGASATYPEELCERYAALAMEHFKTMAHVEYLKKKLRHMEIHVGKMKRKAEVLGAEPTQANKPCSPDRGPKWEGQWRGGYGKYSTLKTSKAKTEAPSRSMYLGGMRHPARTIRSMGAAQSLGIRIQRAWSSFSELNPEVMETAETYGANDCIIHEELERYSEEVAGCKRVTQDHVGRQQGVQVQTGCRTLRELDQQISPG